MLKHTIMFAVVAGLVFALAPAAQAATTNGTFDSISRTGDVLDSVTLDGTEHPLDSLIGVAMNDPPSPANTWYRQRGWIPQTDAYPTTKEDAYAMASDGQLSTIHNFLEWNGGPSWQDYTFDDPVTVGEDSEIALLGDHWTWTGSSVMTFTALDSDGDPVPATTYTPAFSSFSPNVQTLAIQGSDDFNGIWPWGSRWNEGPHTVYGAAMDFSPDDVSEIYGLRIEMSGTATPPVSYLWVNELWAVGGGVPGDLDGDGDVDDIDLGLFEGQFGSQAPGTYTADFDGDEDVDLDDYLVMRNNIGAGAAAAPGATPEPATMTVLAIGGLMVVRRRRRRSCRRP